MPKYGIEFKEKNINNFLEKIQYAQEVIEEMKNKNEAVDHQDASVVKTAIAKMLMACMHAYNLKIKDLPLEEKQAKLKKDSEELARNMRVADFDLSNDLSMEKANLILENSDVIFRENHEFGTLVAGTKGFGPILEFFGNELGEEYILKNLDNDFKYSESLQNKIKEKMIADMKNGEIEEKEIEPEKLTSEQLVGRLQYAEQLIDTKDNYSNKAYDLIEVNRIKTIYLMDACHRYNQYAEKLSNEERKLQVNQLRDVFIKKGDTPEEAEYRASSLLTNKIAVSNSQEKDLYTKKVLKNNLGELVQFFQTTMGKELTDKGAADIDFRFSNEISDLLQSNKEEVKKVENDVVNTKVEEFLNTFHLAENAIQKTDDYLFKLNDQNAIQAAKNSFIMEMMFRYARKDFTKEERENNNQVLASKLTGSNKEDALWRAQELLTAKHTEIAQNKSFAKAIINNDFDEVVRFFNAALGEDVVHKAIDDTQLRLSDPLINKMKYYKVHPEELIPEQPQKVEPIEEIKINVPKPEQVQPKVEEVKQEKVEEPKEDNIDQPWFENFLYQDKMDEFEVLIKANQTLAAQNPSLDTHEKKMETLFMQNAIIDARRLNKLLDEDREIIAKITKDYNIGEKPYNTAIFETIARLAKGEEIFKLQKGKKIENFDDATRFMFEVMGHVNPTFNDVFPDRRGVSNLVQNEMGDMSLEEIKDRIEVKNTMTEIFANCETPAQYKKKFEKTLDKVLKGRIAIPAFKNMQEIDKNTKNIGIAMQQILIGLNESGINTNLLGLDEAYLRDIGYSRVDGVKLSDEFMNKMKFKDLNMVPRNELSPDEARDYKPNDRENLNSFKAITKLKGFRGKGESALYNDALATYAKMEYIHSQRGKLFWLFHPNQNSLENASIETMKELLIEHGLTAEDLELAKNNHKNLSNDDINLASLAYNNTVLHDDILKQTKARSQARQNEINQTINSIEILAASKNNKKSVVIENQVDNQPFQESVKVEKEVKLEKKALEEVKK